MRLLGLALVAAVAPLALVGFSAAHTYAALETASARRQTAYEFLMALRQLRQHVGEARVGLTGYLLTGDSLYRSTYSNGLGGLAADSAALRTLARGQVTLQPLLDRLGPALAAYADDLGATLRAAERVRGATLGPALRRSRDALLLENIRGTLVALEREQTRLMAAGARDVAAAVRRSRALIGITVALGLLLILGAGGAVVVQLRARTAAGHALREREQHMSSIYDTVADVIFRLEVEAEGRYRFTSVNQAFRVVTGLTSDMVVGKRVDEVIPEPSLTLVLQHYAEAIRKRRIVRWEETSDYPTGRLTGEVSVAPVFDDAGRCTHLVGAVHDITARKRAEAALQDLNVQLEQRVVERTAQLEAANQELEAFAYSVSHDLRAPLRAIDGFSRMLVEDRADALDAEGNRLLNVIRSNTQKMDQLITALLALSRATRTPMEARPIDMTGLATATYDEIAPPDLRKTFVLDIAPLPDAYGDPTLIRQVWANLLSNAVKYSLPKTRRHIAIDARTEGGTNVYSVRDNGVGFDPAYAHKLFGVFQRLHPSAEFEGTGIGLALVQRIVHRHGGRVWAEGQVDGGATISFSLPAGHDR